MTLALLNFSLVLFPKINFNTEDFEGLFQIGLFRKGKEKKKGLEPRLCFGSGSLEIAGVWRCLRVEAEASQVDSWAWDGRAVGGQGCCW